MAHCLTHPLDSLYVLSNLCNYNKSNDTINFKIFLHNGWLDKLWLVYNKTDVSDSTNENNVILITIYATTSIN